MSFSSKSDLKAAITNWMVRSDISGDADDIITLAEARLNRELDAVETDSTITGTLDSRSIDISALSMVEPIALFLAETGLDEVELTPKVDGTFPYRAVSSRPAFWAIDGTNIDFDCPLDAAYPFRFRYKQRFSLANDGSTNWLLTNYPDIYLAAAIVWGSVFIKAKEDTAFYKAILDEGLPSIKHVIAQSKRALLTTDPMLQRISRGYGWYGNGAGWW